MLRKHGRSDSSSSSSKSEPPQTHQRRAFSRFGKNTANTPINGKYAQSEYT
jgi:hypothetical protein